MQHIIRSRHSASVAAAAASAPKGLATAIVVCKTNFRTQAVGADGAEAGEGGAGGEGRIWAGVGRGRGSADGRKRDKHDGNYQAEGLTSAESTRCNGSSRSSSRRLGEFYARFYSTMAKNTMGQGQTKDHGDGRAQQEAKGNHHSNHVQQQSAIKATHSHSNGNSKDTASQKMPGRGRGMLNSERGGARWNYGDPLTTGGANSTTESTEMSHDSSTDSSYSLIDLYNPTLYQTIPENQPLLSAEDPSKPPAPPPPDIHKAEEATVHITNSFLEHERLGRELRKMITDKLKELEQAGDQGSKPWLVKQARSYEVILLRNTLRFINKRPIAETAKVVASLRKGKDEQTVKPINPVNPKLFGQQYVPPFPTYTQSERPPVALNSALHQLLTRRPVPINIIPKICYNLLTSPIAPDSWTYNILIRNMVLLRQNVLAELVFQEMVRAGEIPDEYTIVALLELMAKAGDFKGWLRVARIQKHEEKNWQRLKGRVRSKFLMETLIIHAARFGKRGHMRRYIKALRRYWPEDPEPGKAVLTALIRFYGEKREWTNGRACWLRLLQMDIDARANAHAAMGSSAGERVKVEVDAMDERAWYWWLRCCQKCGRLETMGRWAAMARLRGVDVNRLLKKGPQKRRGLHVRKTNKVPVLKNHALGSLVDWWEEWNRKLRSGEMQDEDIQSENLKAAYKAALDRLHGRKPIMVNEERHVISEEEKRELLGERLYKKLYEPASVETAPPGFVQYPDGIIPIYDWGRADEIADDADEDDGEEEPKPELRPRPRPAPDPISKLAETEQEQDKKRNGRAADDDDLISEEKKAQIWEEILYQRMNLLLNRHKGQEVKEARGEIRITDEERARGNILMEWEEELLGGEPVIGGKGIEGHATPRKIRSVHRPRIDWEEKPSS
ncbi:hypothetical protein BDZ91DRAFT_709956 [Kalaharituber pfeilii]|nr:hypothetical protein BDZ91DRAFT_709956 [Kalaharituber pfeilii]